MSTALPLQRSHPSGTPFGRRSTGGGKPRIPHEAPTRTPDTLIAVLLAAFGVALNHSSVLFGFNLSLADPIALLLALVFLASRRLWVPMTPLLFFLLLSIHQLAAALVLAPRWTNAALPISTILNDYIKLGATFLCLLLGMQIVRAGRTRQVLRAYIAGSVAVSSIAVASIALPSVLTVGDLFYGGFRFQGFTNDPNYFAVMTVVALAVLWYDPGIRPHLRLVASVILVGGVLLSASKTGAITLALLVIWRLLGLQTARNEAVHPRRVLAALLALCATVIGLLLMTNSSAMGALTELSARIPALNRLVPLVTDFDSAIGAGGSERGDAWAIAVAIVLFSPLLGVGVGTYLTMAGEFTAIPVLAHNTYLQIAAEWGLIFALIFFAWLARHVLLHPADPSRRMVWAIGSNALLVLLVGSFGLSLNYSRLFWVLLGVTAAAHLLSRASGRIRAESTEAPSDPMALPGPPTPSAESTQVRTR